VRIVMFELSRRRHALHKSKKNVTTKNISIQAKKFIWLELILMKQSGT